MPSGTRETKPLTRRGGQPPTEPAPVARQPRPGVPLAGGEPRVAASGAGQCRSGSRHTVGNHLRVPVKAADDEVLMPCSPKRARKLIERREATPYWSHGVFCIRLNREPSARHKQAVVVGVDPGSKREGFSARSAAHDLLNIDADAKDWVGAKLQARRILRRNRRSRKTPCRSPKRSRENHERVPAGTRARWEWKLRVLEWLATLYPVTDVVVEDVTAAPRKGARKWNASFSPLEAGKRWFYARIEERWQLRTLQGHETAGLRNEYGLKKTNCKTSERWDAHCVDAWTLAESLLATGRPPEHNRIVRITPIQRQRRCLHRANASRGGQRRPYGGTNKGGLKTGTLVAHQRYGLCYTGGAAGGRISLHNLETGKRLCQHARITDCRPRSPLTWRFRFLPALKDGVSTEQT